MTTLPILRSSFANPYWWGWHRFTGIGRGRAGGCITDGR